MTKFRGLSTPEQLKTAWHNLTNLPEDTLNVVWDYEPNKYGLSQLKIGCNIINSRYNPQEPNAIGHYCAIFLTRKKLIYYNPIGGVMYHTCYEIIPNNSQHHEELKRNLIKHFGHNDINKYPLDDALIQTTNAVTSEKKLNIIYDMTGEQRISSNSCGFYCLAKLYDYLINPKKTRYHI